VGGAGLDLLLCVLWFSLLLAKVDGVGIWSVPANQTNHGEF
jgi:hypothetical protein